MDEREFLDLADAQLAAIESALEASEADFDFEMKDGGVLELEFADASKIIINRHAAAQEIWVAARSGGFHFRWDGTDWRGTRDGEPLLAVISRCMTQQAAEQITLTC